MWLESRLHRGRNARYEEIKLEGRKIKGTGGGDRIRTALNARPGG